MDLLIMIFSWALAIVAIIIAIAKRETNRTVTILLVVSSFLSIGTGSITYFKATKADERAKKAEKTAEKINKATNLSIVLGSYNPETQKMWIEEENELKEELKRSKAEEVDKVLAKKSWGLAQDYFQMGEIKACLEFLDHSQFFVETGLIHSFRGLVILGTDTTKAINEYHIALRLNPDLVTAHSNLGAALWKKGLTEEAIAEFHKAIRLKPEYVYAYNNLGAALVEQGKYDDAIAALRKAIELKPDFAPTYYNYGTALVKQGKLDEAIAAYRKVVEVAPNKGEAYINLGAALIMKGDYEEGIAICHKGVELSPENVEAHINLGSAYAMKERYEEAEREFRKAIELKPDYDGVYYNMACSYSLQGEKDRALESLVLAVEKGFVDWPYMEKDKLLKNLRGEPRFEELTEKVKARWEEKQKEKDKEK